MDIFMTNIGPFTTKTELKVALASVLHGQDYAHHRSTVVPMNLEVFIHPSKRGKPSRTGIFTVPTVQVGDQFLSEFGGPRPKRRIGLGTTILFQRSHKAPRTYIVEEIRRMPYQDPRAEDDRQRHVNELLSRVVSLSTIQFGWECRDNVFSIEWEKQYVSSRCELSFDDDRREFRIKAHDSAQTRVIAIRASQINWSSAGMDKSNQTHVPVICLSLLYPPSFETESPEPGTSGDLSVLDFAIQLSGPFPRQRWSSFDNDHAQSGVAPYTSLALRLVCRTSRDLETFRQLSKTANIAKVADFVYPAEKRGLFTTAVSAEYDAWLLRLPWPIAFQVEALTLALVVDLQEIIRLRRRIERLLEERGQEYTVSFLRHFGTQAKTLFWYAEEEQSEIVTIEELFSKCQREYSPPTVKRKRRSVPNPDTFECLHVTVTPTTIHLQGPYPERSNRIMRLYAANHTSFLRVNFVDETDLQYRFDRDVDGRSFIARRVGSMLKEGIWVAGRHFDFLAYSQSALKEHAVWFVKEFIHDGEVVNAQTIIRGIGNFHNLVHDPKLIYCPARYGARISQAFTATDSSVSIQPEEILLEDDIEDSTGKWAFTDGVGTISPDLAREIWKVLRARRRGRGTAHNYPRAFQIRFMGSKGMLSVDYRLIGSRAVTLRPSMIKFEAESRELEIARAFHRPGPFYLNRPFIMILEALGVPYEVFRDLQKAAVQQAQESIRSLENSARLLEAYGLGASYRLTSVMLSLHKLGLGPLKKDNFWSRMMAFAIHHVLRELKYHARIPVPDAWNLVGVADVHGHLEEGDIFACIVPNDGSATIYLEGPTLVSRSPTIHPGDVQVVHAIGRPPPGSPFARESLQNTLVFSVRGSRPLPSYLGGGDLDGDEYRVTMLESLRPPRNYEPANYDPAQRKLLDRPSTMQDVADFVTEYISSDSLGIIAITWLIIADQSTQGIFDPDCLLLSALHSDAVDYAKSGQPVPLSKMPKLKFRRKPDWNAPETVVNLDRFYESQRAIGRLFRDIKLPAVETAKRAQRAQGRHLGDQVSLEDMLEAFRQPVYYEEDSLSMEVLGRVSEFVRVGRHDDDTIAEIWELYTRYVSELRTICADHTLSYAKNAMLTEEEVVVGTIVAQCSQPRRRKDLMSQMREQATSLVDGVRQELSGEEGTLPEKSLERAWVAFRMAEIEEDAFGARSFVWIALGEIFEAIKTIEETEGYD